MRELRKPRRLTRDARTSSNSAVSCAQRRRSQFAHSASDGNWRSVLCGPDTRRRSAYAPHRLGRTVWRFCCSSRGRACWHPRATPGSFDSESNECLVRGSPCGTASSMRFETGRPAIRARALPHHLRPTRPPDVGSRGMGLPLGTLRATRTGPVSKRPGGGSAGVGDVGAVRAGADRPVEVLAELGIVLPDARYRVAEGAGHAGSGALGRRRGAPVAAAEADRARELSNQEVAFGVGLRGSFGVAEGARLVDVVLDLGEAPAVRVLGSWVEELGPIAGARGAPGG